MPKAKSKVTTYRYVVECVVDTDRKFTKKLVQEAVSKVLGVRTFWRDNIASNLLSARARKIDME